MSGPVPVVTVVDGIPRVSSRDIAQKFGKRHDDILKIIRRVSAELPEKFRLGNFAESSYLNGQGKEQPCFNLTRDAFTLVAMGLTGKTALVWKLRYIEAFNAMEAELAKRANPQPLPNGWRDRKGLAGESPRERDNRLKREEEHCTHNEGRRIEAAVNYWCSLRGIRRIDALAAIRVRFGLRIFDRPPLHLHDQILQWISEQCGEDLSGLPTGNDAKTPPTRQAGALPEPGYLPPKPLRQRPPITLRELEHDAEDCQRRLGLLCNGLALTSGASPRGGAHAHIQEAIRDNLNAAHAAAQSALSLLKGIKNLCLAAQ